MSRKLRTSPQIYSPADLGIGRALDPVAAILRLVRTKVTRIASKYQCTGLKDLLAATANEVGTKFIEVRSDGELRQVISEFLTQGEHSFANLGNKLKGPRDYALP